jgi:hypothetical protein|tara:strand:+ start:281 stop:1042 length:762 start_codon:yes stop_codon:yes gene_type:complete
MRPQFKEKFVKGLKEKIPSKILDLGLEFPKKHSGFIRLAKFKPTDVYLDKIKTSKGERVLLKFQYRDFHYVNPAYVLTHIYIAKGDNECRYDSRMNLDSKYLLNQNRIIEDGEIKNCGYKVESLGKEVKTSYTIVVGKPVPSLESVSTKSIQQIDEITDNYDINNTWWLYRGDCKPDKDMYLCIGPTRRDTYLLTWWSWLRVVLRPWFVVFIVIGIILMMFLSSCGTTKNTSTHNCELMKNGQKCLPDHSCCE